MTFSASQIRKLNTAVRQKHVKLREVDGKTLAYIEGWHAISEANRIFGVDAWDRETVSSECTWRKQVDEQFGAAYVTRVRIRVRAGDATIVREGLGAGEAIAPTPGQAHERAIKTSETDATKRALSTFGNSFGLSLYRDKKDLLRGSPKPHEKNAADKSGQLPSGAAQRVPAPTPPAFDGVATRVPVDKSRLPIGEPKRARSLEHLRFVAKEPCLICGRQPSQAHHLRFAQPRAIGRKVSDEFTIPLCSFHHDEVHRTGSEFNWWRARGIDPVGIARALWAKSRRSEVSDPTRSRLISDGVSDVHHVAPIDNTDIAHGVMPDAPTDARTQTLVETQPIQ